MSGPHSDDVAIFVSSSDRTRDVFERVFAAFPIMWPDCPFPRFVGFTSVGGVPERHGFTVVGAKRASGWRAELAEQIAQLPAAMQYVILFLDDFLLLRRVDTKAVEEVVRAAVSMRAPYTRLKAPERSLVASAWRRIARRLRPRAVVELQRNEPYYSSLQVTIWRRDHLLRSLREPGSIWDFEHQALPGETHRAVTSSVIPYRHVVERGEWRAYAPRLLRSSGVPFDPGQRTLRPRIDEAKNVWDQLKFALIGYRVVYLRRVARKLRRGRERLVAARSVE